MFGWRFSVGDIIADLLGGSGFRILGIVEGFIFKIRFFGRFWGRFFRF